jgi:segregation and condensation protein B
MKLPEDISTLIEALIFAAPEPVDETTLIEIIGNISKEQISSNIEELNRHYEETGRAFYIVKGGGGYRFATRVEFSQWVRKLVLGSGRMRLSRAALETLSFIAYRQPVTRSDIERVRGVETGGVLRMLLERKLIKVTGRGEGGGRALQYATTQEFLKYFGINSLDELPQPEELDDHVFD